MAQKGLFANDGDMEYRLNPSNRSGGNTTRIPMDGVQLPLLPIQTCWKRINPS
jgi:hypothetical protein